MKAQIGQKPPLLSVSEWVQGGPVNFDRLIGRVVLVEVFQVNCPGCFLYALPQAIAWHRRYAEQGLTVLGLATAFEDFDKNNLDNLKRLVEHGEVVGETQKALAAHDELVDGRLSYDIPFPLAMDRLVRRQNETSDDDIERFLAERVPDFDNQPPERREQIRQAVRHYFESLAYRAETFERFDLKGTPSHILVDRQGILRDYAFGNSPELEERILEYLEES
ncbi:MAG: TlpA family protein disulfide reductase [Gammaproteobacteria bacterium]